MHKFQVTYHIDSQQEKEIIDSICVEQTIEFPYDLAPAWIQDEVVGKLVSNKTLENNRSEVVINFNLDTTGYELPQFMNVLWGNVSMFANVRIVDLKIDQVFLDKFKGPRFGIEGLRNKFNAKKRPILATALKPMGLSAKELAQTATVMVEAGLDLIKDDHSLANQPWALWEERAKIIASAVNEANSKYNRNAVYAPSVNLPANQILEKAIQAKQLGAGALMVLPGVSSFDMMRVIADEDQVSLPIISHPSFLGSLFMNKNHGLNHEIVLATLMRLGGADITVFPNYGGRFSFTKQECKNIADANRSDLGNIKTIFPSPGGGMTLDRLEETISFYGTDTMLLIGGALHRGNLLENAQSLRSFVDKFEV
jgi:ribulose-bisphosphate carboxylase large chain